MRNYHAPIVSLSGPPGLHERAAAYNVRVSALISAEREVEEAWSWNHRERFGVGMFATTKPPISTVELEARVSNLEFGLASERAEIVVLSGGTVKP